jgi:dihydrofolate synthase/folylpolyglutamate synthase
MNYEETLHWMFKQIPMYQRTGKAAYKVDLEKTHEIDKYFGHPHQAFKTIHVAGTNGKGSVSHIMASVLQCAGYKTGLYTSPHLKDFRERIKINGEMVEKEFVINFIEENKDYFLEIGPSFFEMSVAMAFKYFREQHVDIAVIEVGMGGRLDSTNIITPEVTAITNIGLDHTQFLGNTLEEIAQEKAGTIKKNVPVVIGETNEKTQPVFKDIAARVRTDITFADQELTIRKTKTTKELVSEYNVYQDGKVFLEKLETDLLGNYQSKNIVTALMIIEKLKDKGYEIQEEHTREGIGNVCKISGFWGRWIVLDKKPWMVCDTAHNREGLTYIMDQLKEISTDHIHFVLGFVNDKNLDNVLDLFPKNGLYYFTKADIPRALDEYDLAKKAGEYDLQGKAYASVKEAIKAARENAKKNDLIYIGGSTFVVSEVI